jgi:hypothetical protein
MKINWASAPEGLRFVDSRPYFRLFRNLRLPGHRYAAQAYNNFAMSQMRLTYSRTVTLKSKPKDQRSIIADVLLAADRPLSFAEIVGEARKARYEETFKRGTMIVTIEESVRYHLDAMTKSRTVEISS